MIAAPAEPESEPPSWRWRVTPPALDLANGLVLGAVARLHQLTEAVRQDAVIDVLPHNTLLSELHGILARGGPWFGEHMFVEAVETVLPVVKAIETPLVFSNGDYNPGNFLFDGEKVTGFVDFQFACFEDPHIGFGKYWTYDWYPLNKAGIVERYLETQSLTLADFAPRLAVRCLWTLARGIAVEGGDNAHRMYRERILELLRDALRWMD